MSFGKMHQRNPEIIRVAKMIKRTPSALAMKLVNFASLDPAITNTGRKGLENASSLDREIWDEFNADWETLAFESQLILQAMGVDKNKDSDSQNQLSESYFGETRKAQVEVRIKQSFFRKAVLSSYEGCCCMTRLNDERLLVASHIVPWSQSRKDRLNPRNGLCLSALHDRAFDKGLITVEPGARIRVSSAIKDLTDNEFARVSLLSLDQQFISLPSKFPPSEEFLKYHNQQIFLG
jgi:predicted restriction endonuclease